MARFADGLRIGRSVSDYRVALTTGGGTHLGHTLCNAFLDATSFGKEVA